MSLMARNRRQVRHTKDADSLPGLISSAPQWHHPGPSLFSWFCFALLRGFLFFSPPRLRMVLSRLWQLWTSHNDVWACQEKSTYVGPVLRALKTVPKTTQSVSPHISAQSCVVWPFINSPFRVWHGGPSQCFFDDGNVAPDHIWWWSPWNVARRVGTWMFNSI